jgi:aspartate aminotransferase-like enzyme
MEVTVKDNWEKLVVLLTELVDLYRAILNLSKQKREALIAAKTQDIDTVTRQEELLILQVGKFEAARGKLMRQIADSHGLDVEVLTLSKIAGACRC